MRFCSNCGAGYKIAFHVYPKNCGCGHIAYSNPNPVAVLLQPVKAVDGKIGILVGRRNIHPCKGEWNLIGGYVDNTGESAEVAAAREYHEETGLISKEDIEWESGFYEAMFTKASGRGSLLIFFRSTIMLSVSDLERFKPNYECTELKVVWEPTDLCFPYHTDALKYFYTMLNAGFYADDYN